METENRTGEPFARGDDYVVDWQLVRGAAGARYMDEDCDVRAHQRGLNPDDPRPGRGPAWNPSKGIQEVV